MGYRKKKKQHIEFSKKILVVAAIVNIAVVLFTFIIVWITLDTSPLAYLIPAVAAEVATGTGFYYSKAKVENRIKLMGQHGVEPSKQSFVENGGNYNG